MREAIGQLTTELERLLRDPTLFPKNELRPSLRYWNKTEPGAADSKLCLLITFSDEANTRIAKTMSIDLAVNLAFNLRHDLNQPFCQFGSRERISAAVPGQTSLILSPETAKAVFDLLTGNPKPQFRTADPLFALGFRIFGACDSWQSEDQRTLQRLFAEQLGPIVEQAPDFAKALVDGLFPINNDWGKLTPQAAGNALQVLQATLGFYQNLQAILTKAQARGIVTVEYATNGEGQPQLVLKPSDDSFKTFAIYEALTTGAQKDKLDALRSAAIVIRHDGADPMKAGRIINGPILVNLRELPKAGWDKQLSSNQVKITAALKSTVFEVSKAAYLQQLERYESAIYHSKQTQENLNRFRHAFPQIIERAQQASTLEDLVTLARATQDFCKTCKQENYQQAASSIDIVLVKLVEAGGPPAQLPLELWGPQKEEPPIDAAGAGPAAPAIYPASPAVKQAAAPAAREARGIAARAAVEEAAQRAIEAAANLLEARGSQWPAGQPLAPPIPPEEPAIDAAGAGPAPAAPAVHEDPPVEAAGAGPARLNPPGGAPLYVAPAAGPPGGPAIAGYDLPADREPDLQEPLPAAAGPAAAREPTPLERIERVFLTPELIKAAHAIVNNPIPIYRQDSYSLQCKQRQEGEFIYCFDTVLTKSSAEDRKALFTRLGRELAADNMRPLVALACKQFWRRRPEGSVNVASALSEILDYPSETANLILAHAELSSYQHKQIREWFQQNASRLRAEHTGLLRLIASSVTLHGLDPKELNALFARVQGFDLWADTLPDHGSLVLHCKHGADPRLVEAFVKSKMRLDKPEGCPSKEAFLSHLLYAFKELAYPYRVALAQAALAAGLNREIVSEKVRHTISSDEEICAHMREWRFAPSLRQDYRYIKGILAATAEGERTRVADTALTSLLIESAAENPDAIIHCFEQGANLRRLGEHELSNLNKLPNKTASIERAQAKYLAGRLIKNDPSVLDRALACKTQVVTALEQILKDNYADYEEQFRSAASAPEESALSRFMHTKTPGSFGALFNRPVETPGKFLELLNTLAASAAAAR